MSTEYDMTERQVWKYSLKGVIDIAMPQGSTLLFFAVKDETALLWCEVQPANDFVVRSFQIVGTGQSVPPEAEYIGTCLDKAYVWHLYELHRE